MAKEGDRVQFKIKTKGGYDVVNIGTIKKLKWQFGRWDAEVVTDTGSELTISNYEPVDK